MKAQLLRKLYLLLLQNYPDLLLRLQEENRVTAWLENRLDSLEDQPETMLERGVPGYIVEELCMKELTAGLGPSRYNYLCDLLAGEFPGPLESWTRSSVLVYEVVNILQACDPLFESFGFSGDDVEDRRLRYAVLGVIAEYLETGS